MTEQDLLDLAGLMALEARLGIAAVARIAHVQLNHGRGLVAQLETFGPDADPAAVRRVVHQFAGSSGSLGMVRLADAAVALEIRIQNGDQTGLDADLDAFITLARASEAALAARYPDA